jgi:hypothetical protein
MTAIATTQPRPDTMTGRAAAARLGISQYRLMKLASLGRVRTLAEPGSHLRYVRDDVEALASELGRFADPPDVSH